MGGETIARGAATLRDPPLEPEGSLRMGGWKGERFGVGRLGSVGSALLALAVLAEGVRGLAVVVGHEARPAAAGEGLLGQAGG